MFFLGGQETVGNQLPRRAPSSSEIERGPRTGVRPPVSRPLSPSTTKCRPMSPAGGNTRPVSPKEITPAGKAPRKDVASKIPSLWKKVEDSKKQKKDTNGKDKRVWISKGKVQNTQQQPMKGQHNDSTTSGRLIRSGTYEKLTDPNIQDSKLSDTSAEMIDGKTETKQRTRSRLSIKLSSRFGLKKQQQKGIISAAETTAEDQMNGNTPTALTTAADDLGNSVEMLTSQSSDNEEISPRSGAENNGSGSQISPPSSPRDESSDTPMGPPYSTAINNKLLSKTTTTHLKRNSSYVSSLGRKVDENEDTDDSNEGHTLSPVHEQQVSTNQQKKSFSKTSSSVVTLV